MISYGVYSCEIMMRSFVLLGMKVRGVY